MPLVAVVMGSKSDAASMKSTLDTLDMLGIDYEVKVISAHRNPEMVREYGLAARSNGIEVIIAAAGGAAHLPGVLASWTSLPVIGVPLSINELKGVDARFGSHNIHVQFPGIGIGIVGRCTPCADVKGVSFFCASPPSAMVCFTVMWYRVNLRTPPAAGVIDLIVPEDHLSSIIDSGFYLNNRRGSEAVIKEFFGAAPGDLNGTARPFCQAHGFNRLRVSALAPETAADIRRDDADIFFRYFERLGYPPLISERRLG